MLLIRNLNLVCSSIILLLGSCDTTIDSELLQENGRESKELMKNKLLANWDALSAIIHARFEHEMASLDSTWTDKQKLSYLRNKYQEIDQKLQLARSIRIKESTNRPYADSATVAQIQDSIYKITDLSEWVNSPYHKQFNQYLDSLGF